jgi:hypothetical protein
MQTSIYQNWIHPVSQQMADAQSAQMPKRALDVSSTGTQSEEKSEMSP